MIADVRDIQGTLAVQGDRVRAIERCLHRRAAVAGEPALASAGDRRDRAVTGIDPSDHRAEHLDEVHVAVVIEANFVRVIELGLDGGSAVAGVAGLARPHNRRNRAVAHVDATDPVSVDLAHVQRAVRPQSEAIRISDPCGGCRTAVPRRAGDARASQRISSTRQHSGRGN